MATHPFSIWMLSLDDESFFSVVRNYLGPVHTPYNKQELIGRLTELLSSDETQSKLISLLADDDRVVISAVMALPRSRATTIVRLLADTMPERTLHRLVHNLKDRLIIVETEPGVLLVNPILRERFESLGLGERYLIAADDCEEMPSGAEEESAPLWCTPSAALAAVTMASELGELRTRDGRLRKRAQTAIDERFGALLGDGEARYARFAALLDACERLGLARNDPKGSTVRWESWDAYAQLDRQWAEVLLVSATICGEFGQIGDLAHVILDLRVRAGAVRCFEPAVFARLLRLSGNALSLDLPTDAIDKLIDAGVVRRRDGLLQVAGQFNGGDGLSGGVRVAASMEATVAHGTPLDQVVRVARVGRLVRCDAVTTWELTEVTVAAARRSGVEQVKAHLESVVGTLPQNVAFLIDRWEQRATAVRVLQGTVVVARGEEESLVLESAPAFQEQVRARLADGIYLMRESDSALIAETLNRLGVAIGDLVETSTVVDINVPSYTRLVEQRRALPPRPSLSVPAPDSESEAPPSPGADEYGELREHLLKELGRRAYAEDVHEELALRIRRGLILNEEQLRPDLVPQFGNEARGLDFVGKVRLIEGAIRTGDNLELIMRESDGSPTKMQVAPREIVEQTGELMLRAVELATARAIRIRVRRISIARRLSGALIRRGPEIRNASE